MNVVWAIAHKMIQEAIRKRIPIALGIFVIVMILCLPLALKSDGSLQGQVQLTLAYSIYLSFMMLSLLTIFLAAMSFTGEIKAKQYYLLDTKPIYRWQFFAGKFLGLSLLNFAFLVVIGATVWVVLSLLISSQPKAAQAALNDEILNCYRGCKPYINFKSLEILVEQEYQKRKQQNRLPQEQSEEEVRRDIQKEQLNLRHWVPYKGERSWLFKEIPATLKSNPQYKLKLRYKFFSSQASAGRLYMAHWRIGKGDNVYTMQTLAKTGEILEFTIPTAVIAEKNFVEVRFINQDPAAGYIYFPLQDGLELLYPAGSFGANYFRGMMLLLLILCFLILVTLFASTFLTFHVAVLVAFYIMGLGLIADFLMEMMPLGTEILSKERQNLWYYVSQYTLSFMFTLLPSFSDYNPVEYLSRGRIIETSLVIEAVGKLLLIRGGILATLGCLIFHHREIGKPLE